MPTVAGMNPGALSSFLASVPSADLGEIPQETLLAAADRLENAATKSANSSATTVKLTGNSAAPVDADEALQVVKDGYGKTVRGEEGCCTSVDSTLNGYSIEELAKVAGADFGLGCGNPLSFANLQPGERVVDLGSGAGIDVQLAAIKVGATGQAIGVDMTPDMVHKARTLVKEKGISNAEYRLGEIEHIPVADGEIDCVISNCVINLSPDKQQVCREIYRILRPGGRVAISDVILTAELPEHLKTAEALAC